MGKIETGKWKLGNRNPQPEAARRRLFGKIDHTFNPAPVKLNEFNPAYRRD
jgi:hypothetical protein